MNTIIGILDIKLLSSVLDFVDNVLTLKFAKIKFRIHGGCADNDLPSSITFDPSTFICRLAVQSVQAAHSLSLVTMDSTALVTMDSATAYHNLPITHAPVSIQTATAETADILSCMVQSQSE